MHVRMTVPASLQSESGPISGGKSMLDFRFHDVVWVGFKINNLPRGKRRYRHLSRHSGHTLRSERTSLQPVRACTVLHEAIQPQKCAPASSNNWPLRQRCL